MPLAPPVITTVLSFILTIVYPQISQITQIVQKAKGYIRVYPRTMNEVF
jgi:hypothetical protein